uniref:ABC transporter domain-containing protein n=1 Tax=Lotharella globosa TaxID=91324 RepID=A0A6U3AZ91_9EUKA|mmetsp:Transcript_27278/g.52890  ORF Transcript_27278/g.52890 Transcript_27278/m.52890 type:complete len:632 (+) Transcript_27278:58-1953(+)
MSERRDTYRRLQDDEPGDVEAKGEPMESPLDYKNPKRQTSGLSIQQYEEPLADDEVFPELTVSFRHLTCKVETVDHLTKGKITKTILDNVSGVFVPGSMVAIMGPSGSGKTTLLDCIAQKKTLPYSGEIRVNGHPVDSLFQRVIGYVPQEDFINENVTVRECLTFSARLKAQHDDDELITETVDWALQMLSLTEVAEQRVGGQQTRGISGGQKRRVCIGRALVAKPGVLFADEPTSGLSATDALLVMQCIRNIARRNRMTVAAVIHQPRHDVFARFDHLLLLAGGRCCYNGPRKEALGYFKAVREDFECPTYTSPADHFLDLVTIGSEVGEPDTITEYFEAHKRKGVEATVLELPTGARVRDTITWRPEAQFAAPFCRQFKCLLERELRLNVRDPQKITAKAGNALVMGVLIGMMYYHVKDAFTPAFGYIGLAILSMSAMVSLPSFFSDRLMFNLERMDQMYPTFPYYVVNTGVGIVISLVWNVLFSIIVWAMSGLSWDKFSDFLLIGFAVFWATDGLVTLIASTCRTMEQAMALFNMTIGLFLLFNGFSANTKTTPSWLSWLCFGSPLYYSLEMFLESLYANTPMWQTTGELYGMRKDAFWSDWFTCLAIGFGGRILAFFAMKYMHRIQR